MRAPVNIHDSMKMLHNNSNSKPKQLHLCAYRDKMKPYYKTVFYAEKQRGNFSAP